MRKMSKLAMTNPVTYNKYNKLQNRDNKKCLIENVDRMAWRGGDRVLDIGSGDGSFTATELRRFLPDDVTELCDRSREMMDFANEHFGGEGIHFRVLEIGKPLPADLALSQIYDILSGGGDCLLLMVGNGPAIYDVYKILSRSPNWCRWVTRLDEVLSPYHDCEDPENKLTIIAKSVGFKQVYVKCNRTSYTFDSIEDYKSMIVAINPFNIPKELSEEYLDEFVRVAKDKRYITEDLTASYITITFYGSK